MKNLNIQIAFFQKIMLLLLFMTINLSGCKDKYAECTDADYRACNTEYPTMGRVLVLLTWESDYPTVIVRVFEGNFEDGKLLLTDTIIWSSKVYYSLTPEVYYSFTATYEASPQAIVAIDGGKIRRSSYQMCELKCYELDEPTFDLRID